MIPGGYSGGGGMEMTYRVISIKYGIFVFIVRWRIVILKVENARYSWGRNIDWMERWGGWRHGTSSVRTGQAWVRIVR